MPKETIRGEGFDVEVTWGRDQAHVQVATVIRPPTEPTTTTPVTLPGGGVATVEAPASLGTLIETWSAEERFTARGLYATVTNRHAINELIRVLRRARDQAFGRDE